MSTLLKLSFRRSDAHSKRSSGYTEHTQTQTQFRKAERTRDEYHARPSKFLSVSGVTWFPYKNTPSFFACPWKSK
jgi:hypothetical protein